MTQVARSIAPTLADQLARSIAWRNSLPPPPVEGQLTRMVGLTLEALGCQAAVGDRCEVISGDGSKVDAEVVGFSGDRLYLMPTGDVHGVKPSARVIPRPGAGSVRVGPELLGRVIDGAGEPLDGRGPLELRRSHATDRRAHQSAVRARPSPAHAGCGRARHQFAADCGRGQRIGLFAGSGVGKSVLLGMMARYTEADVIVVGLIGERGREVKEFIERILGEEGRRRRWSWPHRPTAAADAPARRLAGHGHRRVLPRPGQERPADHGFADALRPGAARDRPRHRRGAGHQGLSALGVRAPAAAGGTRRQCGARVRVDHRLLHRAGRGRRPAAIRSPTARAPFSMGTSCCRAASPRPGTIRRSTSRPPSAA